MFEKDLYVRKLNGNNATISTLKTGAVTGVVNTIYLKKIDDSSSIFPYLVKVIANELNVRKGAGTNYAVKDVIKDKGVYTIVNEKSGQGATKWLELKSGGYISSDFVEKLEKKL